MGIRTDAVVYRRKCTGLLGGSIECNNARHRCRWKGYPERSDNWVTLASYVTWKDANPSHIVLVLVEVCLSFVIRLSGYQVLQITHCFLGVSLFYLLLLLQIKLLSLISLIYLNIKHVYIIAITTSFCVTPNWSDC